MIVTFVEITRMVEAEAQQRTLIEELNHRVRNMLTVVNAIAKQTAAQTRSPEEFTAAFDGRIQAMAASYNLVLRENWKEVGLRDLIAEQLKPHQLAPGERVEIGGPEVQLKPNGALALGLVVHEFTTNAVKHGSLSVPDGRVSITWSFQHDALPLLLVHWVESGGPPAKEPTTKGFGTKLVERELRQTLGGSVRFRYNEPGLEATLSIPFDAKMMSLGSRSKPS